jgi:hypothetical protein
MDHVKMGRYSLHVKAKTIATKNKRGVLLIAQKKLLLAQYQSLSWILP